MNISCSWLRKYIDFDLTPDELAEILTSIGLECGGTEKYESIKGGLEGIVIGKVLTCIDHPNSDHLHITTVDLGAESGSEPLQIVCGAPNIAAGQTVPVATIGTTLYSGDESFNIKKGKIRGEVSYGMICSADELGVGSDHSGIMVLPDDLPAGLPASEYFDIISDTIIEVDITPNRVDATSHYGVARDLYAYLLTHGYETALKLPEVNLSERIGDIIPVSVTADEACLRYSGVVIRGVKVGPSPSWLRQALESIGQKSINNVVDITNYVLHEIGQPLHAFDLSKIDEGIVVRMARDGEKMVTLDGEERTLCERDLVIADTHKPLCLAGVLGGIDSGVTEQTTDLFLESATFHPTYIRKSARRYALNTDASFRFERGLDPEATTYALMRAASLITEIAGGEISVETYDHYPHQYGPYEITLSTNKVNSLLGIDIPKDKIVEILDALAIRIADTSVEPLQLQVPRYRYDVTRDVDVIEEILRIYGYNNVPLTNKLVGTISPTGKTDMSITMQQRISEQLVGCGFMEILNNSLSKESYYEGQDETSQVKLLNPLSSDLSTLRQTLLYGGLETIAFNLNRQASSLRLFEFGSCYHRTADHVETLLKGFEETFKLGVWMTGDKTIGNWIESSREVSPYELKTVVYNIISKIGLSPAELEYNTINDSDIWSEAECISLKGAGDCVRWGIVKPSVLKSQGIACPVYYAEIDWDKLMNRTLNRKISIKPIPKFPIVKRDFALLVDESVTFAQIEKTAYKVERKFLQGLTLFDVYDDPKHLPEGKKSYAVSFELRDAEKTLSDKTIEKTMERIYNALNKELGATLR